MLKSLSILLPFFFMSCHDDLDDVLRPADNVEIGSFIWRGMNNMYLYKADIPELTEGYFTSEEELHDFLLKHPTPEDLFYGSLVSPQDRFSFLVDDYVELEKSFSGIRLSTGMEYGLMRLSNESEQIFGYVRYVLPNTSAEMAGIRRGDVFYSIDGVELTLENYSDLLARESLELGMAEIRGNLLRPLDKILKLQKAEYTENPVHIAETIDAPSGTVGYLMYNGFTHTFDQELNDAFGMFKAQGISELVIDLRYNGGGSVESAVDLASMVTGQFEGEVFARQQWNTSYQEYFEREDPEELINRFNTRISNGAAINNLGLPRVYVLTTGSTASASELLINGLTPYIEVIQIGTHTTGKFQASVTLYDSPDFGRRHANINHTYAIQPLIYKSMNSQGKTDYLDGLSPTVPLQENVRNLGILGQPEEPLLQAALNHIQGRMSVMTRSVQPMEIIDESGSNEMLYQRMYVPALEAEGASTINIQGKSSIFSNPLFE